MRAVLGETFRLLGHHLHLFTLLSLTVWLPTHVLLNYLEFFDPGEEAAGRALRIVLTAQVVLDPFGGSGSTLIAAERTGRQARLIEFDPVYCDQIIGRYEALSGKQAVLAGAETSFEMVAEERREASLPTAPAEVG